MMALILGVAGYAALIVLKTRLPQMIKNAVMGSAVVVIIAMLVLDAKFWGVVLMGVSVLILAAMPWLDLSPVKSIRYRPDWHKIVYIVVWHRVFDIGLSRCAGTYSHWHVCLASLHLHLFWIFLADALVEPNG
jgi:quinol-cytochrome oxidoreductase complex cytochrome b subunit